MANERGLEVEWATDPLGHSRYMVTRFYVSAFEYCPHTDSNLLYASLADDARWFDAWPGVMELKNSHRPLKLTYGDDTPFTHEEAQLWTDILDDYGTPVRWERGDLAVVCNYRWAHGRAVFSRAPPAYTRPHPAPCHPLVCVVSP